MYYIIRLFSAYPVLVAISRKEDVVADIVVIQMLECSVPVGGITLYFV